MTTAAPVKPGVGVKVSVPLGFTVTVPFGLVGVPEMVSVSPSTSVSLPRTAKVTGVLNGVVEVSGFASGASFTGVTVTVTVEVEVFPSGSVTV